MTFAQKSIRFHCFGVAFFYAAYCLVSALRSESVGEGAALFLITLVIAALR